MLHICAVFLCHFLFAAFGKHKNFTHDKHLSSMPSDQESKAGHPT